MQRNPQVDGQRVRSDKRKGWQLPRKSNVKSLKCIITRSNTAAFSLLQTLLHLSLIQRIEQRRCKFIFVFHYKTQRKMKIKQSCTEDFTVFYNKMRRSMVEIYRCFGEISASIVKVDKVMHVPSCRQHVSMKRRYIFIILHRVTYQKTAMCLTTTF
jgi:hypothetical protein